MRQTSTARIGALAIVGVAALSLIQGCKKHAAPPAPPPPEVAVVQVQPERLPTTFEFTGEVQPYRRVEVRARIDGIIEARPFTEGSVVKPGQVLYRLERIRPEAAYESALARAENAKRTLDRLQPLVKENAVAQQDVDNAEAENRAAQSDLAEARKNLEDAVVRAVGMMPHLVQELSSAITRTNLILDDVDRHGLPGKAATS
ncbi:MAG TPA: biotin/lipoyl-binding protein, partial [Gemmatimonadales bacterium]